MRNPNKGLATFLSGVLAVALPSTIKSARADVLCEPRPEDTSQQIAKWERGNNYRVNVWAHNNGPEWVEGAQWMLNMPSGLESSLNNFNWGRPSAENEFFNGAQLFASTYGPVGNLSVAIVQSENAPPGREGNLEFYDFTVTDNTPLGVFDFSLGGDTGFFYAGGGGAYSTNVDNYQFRIMPRKGDVNADGNINGNDVAVFTQVLLGNATQREGEVYAGEYCDWSGNDDGQLDGRDIQGFVNALISG